ncbi:hypothetical protein Pst134EA_024471 [Puccinia striiformis f. sp. tritici]|uniref:hypothetical protein n=1 Tax=Puccinia striiformis f. sp. tritici TaxID=168172 RepID=UPI0020073A72|nr:hypothetical protein Pst134EA_024471 [Puccinia striiformis f. sp. tritici]KAH9453603.1 hypothetical protein Pst134EA_024471 [Puccinia striiformis f. sp. tritici]
MRPMPMSLSGLKPSTNSTLNVADFETIEALADRIKQRANDCVSFESTLAWKNEQFPERFEEILESTSHAPPPHSRQQSLSFLLRNEAF